MALDIGFAPDATQPSLIHPIVGEVDLAVVPDLREAIERTMAKSTAPIELDLTRMSFIDASGLGLFVWFATEMRRQSRPARLRGASPMAAKVLRLSGVHELFAAEEWEG